MPLLHEIISFKLGENSNGWTIPDARKAPHVTKILIGICKDLRIVPADVPSYSFDECADRLQNIINKCNDKNGYSVAISIDGELLNPGKRMHGGARSGAGRNPIDKTPRNFRVSCRVSTKIKTFLSSQTKTESQLINEALKNYYKID